MIDAGRGRLGLAFELRDIFESRIFGWQRKNLSMKKRWKGKREWAREQYGIKTQRRDKLLKKSWRLFFEVGALIAQGSACRVLQLAVAALSRLGKN